MPCRLSAERMPELAAETLVAAHETILDRWSQQKPEQHDRLSEIVRADPVYRPLAPSPIEATFYRERRAYIDALPRYRVRETYDIINDHRGGATAYVAHIEDTSRMALYRGRVGEIVHDSVDWPDDVVAFARDALSDGVADIPSSPDSDSPEAEERPLITEVLPPGTLADAATVAEVEETALWRALTDLQATLVADLPGYVREYDVHEYGDDHVVVFADEEAVDNALAGYGDDLRAAARYAHRLAEAPPGWVERVPLRVACAPGDVRRACAADPERDDGQLSTPDGS